MKILAIPALQDNYIWIVVNDNKQALVVDPGEAAPVIAFLSASQLQLAGILITHHHWDHTGGVVELVDYAKEPIPVYGSAHEHVARLSMPVVESDEVMIPGFPTFTVIDIPGHTLGHVAYYAAPVLFCGDTLFAAGCGRVFEGTAAQMYASLLKLKALPDETEIYCAHEYTVANLRFALLVEPENVVAKERLGEAEALRRNNEITLPSLMAAEKATNPFLRCQVETVKQAAETYAKESLQTESEVFAVLREWKNVAKV